MAWSQKPFWFLAGGPLMPPGCQADRLIGGEILLCPFFFKVLTPLLSLYFMLAFIFLVFFISYLARRLGPALK